MAKHSQMDDSEARLANILDSYMASLERGERPDREQLVAQFPELADVLRDALVSLEFVTQARSSASATQAGNRGATDTNGISQELLGDYRIIREIGRGGMGIVYEAHQLSLGRRVALKVLPFVSVLDSRQLARFRNEAQAAAVLTHQNIVPVFAVGCERGVHYFAMQLIDGLSLAELLQQMQSSGPSGDATIDGANPTAARPLSPDAPGPGPDLAADQHRQETMATGILSTHRAGDRGRNWYKMARLMIQACDALDYAHRQGIVHRDIKPANLMLDMGGNLWVTDFGLARIENNLELTASGDLLGTLRYMSPEQVLAQRPLIDHRSDLYSLGATLFELLTLQPAVRGKNREEIIQEIALGEPRSARKLIPGIPRELDTITGKAMARDPADRYQTAANMAEDLRRFLDNRPILAKPPGWWQRAGKWTRRHKVFVRTALAGLAVSLVVALAVLAYSNYQISSERQAALLAERHQREQLVESQVQRARALRQTKTGGRRLQALQLLGRARELSADLNLPDETARKLRDEAIACLATIDLQQAGFVPIPKKSRAGFDRGLTRFATANQLNQIQVRSAAGARLLAEPGTEHASPWSLAMFSPDGRFVAAVDQRDQCTVWHIESDKVRCQIETWRGAIDFSPDGLRLYCGQSDGSLIVIELATGCEIRRLPPGAIPEAIRIDPSGDRVAVCRYNSGDVVIRDLQSGDVLQTLDGHLGLTGDVAWNHEGTLVAVGCLDSRIYVWDVQRRQVTCMMHHPRQVTRVRFSPDGRFLASAGHDANTRLWRVSDGQLLARAPGQFLDFDQSGRRLSFQTPSGVGIWQLSGQASLITCTSRNTPDGMRLVEFDPRGQLIVSAGIHGAVLWDRNTGRELAWLPLDDCGSVKFNSSGSCLYTASPAGLYCWPIQRYPERASLTLGPPARIADLPVHSPKIDLSTNDRLMICPESFNSATILDLQNPDHPPLRLAGHNNLHYLNLSHDLRWAVSCAWPGNDVVVWNLKSGAQIATLAGVHDNAPALAPDGKWLATVTPTEYRLFETDTWQHVKSIPLESPRLGAVTFSPDGRLMAVSQRPGKVVLLETATVQTRAILELPVETTVSELRFDADGTLLAVASVDQFQVWNLRSLAGELHQLEMELPAELQFPAQTEWYAGASVDHIRIDLGELADREDHRGPRARPVARHANWAERIAAVLKWMGARLPVPGRESH